MDRTPSLCLECDEAAKPPRAGEQLFSLGRFLRSDAARISRRARARPRDPLINDPAKEESPFRENEVDPRSSVGVVSVSFFFFLHFCTRADVSARVPRERAALSALFKAKTEL